MRGLLDGGWVDGFRWYLQAQGLSQHSIKNYTNNARWWIEWCREHEIDFRSAGRDAVTLYLGHRAETRKQATVMLSLLCIRYFYDYLIEEKEAISNPARLVKYRQPQAPPTQPFSPEEMRRMYYACQNFREQAVFLLLAFAGLRRSEVFSIRRADCDFASGSVLVLGKGSKYRRVNPGPAVMEVLDFALKFGEQLCPFAADDYVERLVQRLAKKAGLHGRIYPHRFRHTFATTFLEAGGQIDELMIILGHARPEQSMYYARATQQRRALTRMQELDLPALIGVDRRANITVPAELVS